MVSRSISTAIAVGAAMASFSAPAHATQIVQSMFLVDGTLNPISTFSLNRFDSSLGTLTGVSAEMSWGGIGFANIRGVANTGYRVLGAITANAVTDGPLNIFLISLPGLIGTLDANGQASRFFDATAQYSYSEDPANFAGFIGTSPMLGTFSQSIQVGVLTPGGSGFAGVILPTGQLKLTYDYVAATAPSAVPEPATWSMMIAGFGVIGHTMRRRRRMHVVRA